MSDVSRETAEEHEKKSPSHRIIESEKPQSMFNPLTRIMRPVTIEYRADGCITWREGI